MKRGDVNAILMLAGVAAIAATVCAVFTIAIFIQVCYVGNDVKQIEKNTCVAGASSYNSVDGKVATTGCQP